MDNETLLQRCETLEIDFNALKTYLDKRTFIIDFHKDFKKNEATKKLLDDFFVFNSSKPPYVLNPHHKSKIVEEFSSKLTGKKKIKFDAYYKVLELLENEFNKIEKVVIIDLIASIFIYVCRRQNQNLKEISNLIKDSSQNAISEFETLIKKSIKKNDYSFKYLIYEKIEDYNVDHYVGLNFERVMDAIEYDLESFGLRIGTFHSDNQFYITGEDLAPKIITKIDSIFKDKTKPPTNGNITVYKPGILEPCKDTAINAKVTYLIGIGEMDKIIEQYTIENKLPKPIDVLDVLKELKFKNKENNEVCFFEAKDFNQNPHDNKAITQYIRSYLHYKETGFIEGSWPITSTSIHKVKSKLKNPKYKEFEMLFNADLP